MRTPTISSAGYSPGNVPDDPAEMRRYLQGELDRIAATLSLLSAGHIDQTNAAPTKPRTGDIRLADGTNWNPGSGQGVYAYYGSAWHKL